MVLLTNFFLKEKTLMTEAVSGFKELCIRVTFIPVLERYLI